MSGEWDALQEMLSAVDSEISAATRRVRRLKDERLRLIADAVTAYLSRNGRSGEWWGGYELADAGRACPGSPTGRCVYGVVSAELHDPCFFCGGEPEGGAAPPIAPGCDCSECAGTHVVVNSMGNERPCDYCGCTL